MESQLTTSNFTNASVNTATSLMEPTSPADDAQKSPLCVRVVNMMGSKVLSTYRLSSAWIVQTGITMEESTVMFVKTASLIVQIVV